MNAETPESAPEQDGTHCRLAPSGAHRWLNCPGSAQLGLPESNSQASEEGSLAHARASAALLDRDIAPEYADQLAALSDEAFDGMTAAISVYLEYVRGIPGQTFVEHPILSSIVPEFGGTLDFLAVTDDAIHVVDYKHGERFVPIVGNPQVKSYLNLAREQFPGRKIFHGTIVQPRVLDGRIETVEFTYNELQAHLVDVIEASVDSSIVAGHWCKWCPLLPNCQTAFDHAKHMADEEFTELPTGEDGPDPISRCVAIVQFAPVVQRMADLARERMLTHIQHGGKIDGYKAAQSLGHRAWTDPDAMVATLSKHGVGTESMFHAPVLKSPAQLEKIVPKSLLESLYHRPLRGIAVVPESSKLQEVVFNEFTSLPE